MCVKPHLSAARRRGSVVQLQESRFIQFNWCVSSCTDLVDDQARALARQERSISSVSSTRSHGVFCPPPSLCATTSAVGGSRWQLCVRWEAALIGGFGSSSR